MEKSEKKLFDELVKTEKENAKKNISEIKMLLDQIDEYKINKNQLSENEYLEINAFVLLTNKIIEKLKKGSVILDEDSNQIKAIKMNKEERKLEYIEKIKEYIETNRKKSKINITQLTKEIGINRKTFYNLKLNVFLEGYLEAVRFDQED